MTARRADRKILPAVRAVEAELIGLARDPVATVRLVIADVMPLVVMYEGEPYLHQTTRRRGAPVYFKVRPYRIDDSMVLR